MWQEWPHGYSGMANRHLSCQNSALKSSPVVEDEMKCDSWCACVPTDTPSRQIEDEEWRGVKRWIVQVMHSLRLLSLVSHTVAPMHSLSTLSHVKNKKKRHKHKLLLQCKKSEERGKRWKVLLLRQRASPAGKGADSWCCLQMLMDLDVCNKEEECQQLANKKMRVNKKKIQQDKPHEQGQAGAV